MQNSEVSSPEIAQLNRAVTYINMIIILSKAIPWIVIGLATWSLTLGILDIAQQNWIWVVINFALALSGYSFAISIFRKGQKHRNAERVVSRTYPHEDTAARKHAEAA